MGAEIEIFDDRAIRQDGGGSEIGGLFAYENGHCGNSFSDCSLGGPVVYR